MIGKFVSPTLTPLTMDAALHKLNANLLLVDEESGQSLLEFQRTEFTDVDLSAVGANFVGLNKLSHNLKLGPLQQVVVANPHAIEVGSRHTEKTVAAVVAGNIESALTADSLVDQLLQETP